MLWVCSIQRQAQGKTDAARVSLMPPPELSDNDHSLTSKHD